MTVALGGRAGPSVGVGARSPHALTHPLAARGNSQGSERAGDRGVPASPYPPARDVPVTGTHLPGPAVRGPVHRGLRDTREATLGSTGSSSPQLRLIGGSSKRNKPWWDPHGHEQRCLLHENGSAREQVSRELRQEDAVTHRSHLDCSRGTRYLKPQLVTASAHGSATLHLRFPIGDDLDRRRKEGDNTGGLFLWEFINQPLGTAAGPPNSQPPKRKGAPTRSTRRRGPVRPRLCSGPWKRRSWNRPSSFVTWKRDVTRTVADDREPSQCIPRRHGECVQQLSSGRASALLWAAQLPSSVLAVSPQRAKGQGHEQAPEPGHIRAHWARGASSTGGLRPCGVHFVGQLDWATASVLTEARVLVSP